MHVYFAFSSLDDVRVRVVRRAERRHHVDLLLEVAVDEVLLYVLRRQLLPGEGRALPAGALFGFGSVSGVGVLE